MVSDCPKCGKNFCFARLKDSFAVAEYGDDKLSKCLFCEHVGKTVSEGSNDNE